jgi:uncharacterized OsmC-like protein
MQLEGFLTDTYQIQMNIDGHEYIADRELERNGKNEGTSPHGLLLGSVAACKGMVARGYLDKNNHSFDRIEIKGESKIQGKPRQETIDIEVELKIFDADLNDKDLRFLNRIVEKGCTMANILTAGGENKVSVNIIVE